MKVKMNISPKIMNEVFDFSKNSTYELRCVTASLDQTSILRILGSSLLQIMLLKYETKYLPKSKKQVPLHILIVKLKNWFHRVALIDFAKSMWDKWVLYN